MKDSRIGQTLWFEYHCLESPVSSDAELWYRSHSRVKVISRGIDDNDEFPDEPRVYIVQFDDGKQFTVFDDELVNDQSKFCRPAPPLQSVNLIKTKWLSEQPVIVQETLKKYV